MFFGCNDNRNVKFSTDDFIGIYNSSDDNILDTLKILKNKKYQYFQYNEINNSLVLMDSGIWSLSDHGYNFSNYRFNVNDSISGSINFKPYFGAFDIICMDLDLNGQYKYVKVKE